MEDQNTVSDRLVLKALGTVKGRQRFAIAGETGLDSVTLTATLKRLKSHGKIFCVGNTSAALWLKRAGVK